MNNTEKSLITSYKVAEVRAQNYKPIFTEEVNLPVCKKIFKLIFGPAVVEEIVKEPLSKNMVNRRIIEMSEDIKHNERLHTGEKFSLQLDGTVYVRNIPANFICKICG